MRHFIFTLLMLTLALAAPLPAQEIETEVVAVLRGEEGDGFGVASIPIARWNGYWVVRQIGGGPVSLYDEETGAFVRNLGRRGEGPMEWQAPLTAEVVGDSLFVLDIRNIRMSVIGPDLELVRDFPFPVMGARDFAVLPDGTIALAATMPERELAGKAVYFAEPVAGFKLHNGIDSYEITPRTGARRGSRQLEVADDELLTLDYTGTIRRFGLKGRDLRSEFTFHTDMWTMDMFDKDYLRTGQTRDRPPPSFTRDFAVVGDRLLVVTGIPVENWKAHLKRPTEAKIVEYLYDNRPGTRGVVDLVNPATGESEAYVLIDEYPLDFIDGQYFASSREDELGLHTITIRRILLSAD